MAAEGVHMTALEESVLGPSRPVAREVSSLVERHRSLARLGAVLVDLAYFENFGSMVIRHLAGTPQIGSAWGDRLHKAGPQRLLEALLVRVRDGRASDTRGGPGKEPVLALAMGLSSHLAVDVVTHPVIEVIAGARSRALGTTISVEHERVERLQSALFHERFFGRDLFARQAWFSYVDVPGVEWFNDARFSHLLLDAMREAFGTAPSQTELRAWARGYRNYARVLGSPLGKVLVTDKAKDEAREVLYRGPGFDYDDLFRDAERASTAYVETAYAFGRGDVDSEELERVIPIQSIDHPTFVPSSSRVR